jgi:hypothetical protein
VPDYPDHEDYKLKKAWPEMSRIMLAWWKLLSRKQKTDLRKCYKMSERGTLRSVEILLGKENRFLT